MPLALKPLLAMPLGLFSILLGPATPQLIQPLGLERENLQVEWRSPWIAGLSRDPVVDQILAQYLDGLRRQGWSLPAQGIWIQAGNSAIAQHQGHVPLPAASLTKLATSLAALKNWPLDHRFETLVGLQGRLENGILEGDLVIQGSGDPLFVWEEGIALANRLQELGLQRVTGDLLVVGPFTMNFREDPQTAATDLKQVMTTATWTGEVWQAYRKLDPGTAQPSLRIDGQVRRLPPAALATPPTWVVRHQSLPLVAILKAMNIYSNNVMSEQVADLVGGARVVTETATAMADLPPGELSLVNGSGLGMNNQMSARAAVAMTVALQQELAQQGYSIADLLPVAGEDIGTLIDRRIPPLKPVAWRRSAPWLAWCPPLTGGRYGLPLLIGVGLSQTCVSSRTNSCKPFRPTGGWPQRRLPWPPKSACKQGSIATAIPGAISTPEPNCLRHRA
ncbi:MAG TPA: D-alanyl-D-alanine carboxypeptidase [Leptolyngbyaceae cyanobacterium M65_K2018_010]|nr:D-alanyl-D-alanine carboxypeptidase [Leptolyngbyaceae cyanobacterium M65_K2018_010]